MYGINPKGDAQRRMMPCAYGEDPHALRLPSELADLRAEDANLQRATVARKVEFCDKT